MKQTTRTETSISTIVRHTPVEEKKTVIFMLPLPRLVLPRFVFSEDSSKEQYTPLNFENEVAEMADLAHTLVTPESSIDETKSQDETTTLNPPIEPPVWFFDRMIQSAKAQIPSNIVVEKIIPDEEPAFEMPLPDQQTLLERIMAARSRVGFLRNQMIPPRFSFVFPPTDANQQPADFFFDE